MEIAIVMPVGEVPVGSTISKKTGQKKYEVYSEYRIFAINQHIDFKVVGSRLLIPKQGTFAVNAIPNETEVIWYTDRDKLADYVSLRGSELPPKKPRFRVEANLVQWHVVDSTLEPADAEGIGGEDAWSVAMWQRNQFGDEVCRRKAEALCDLLNNLPRSK